jgi:hypothetical protein
LPALLPVLGLSSRGFAARTVGEGLRAVHFIEMGFADAGSAATRGPPAPILPRKWGGRRELSRSDHVLEHHPADQPQNKASDGAEKRAGDAVTAP